MVSGVAPGTHSPERRLLLAVALAEFTPLTVRNPARRRIEPAGGGCYHRFQWQLHAPPQLCPPPLFWPDDFSRVPAAAKVEKFLEIFVEPQCGHFVPFQSLERTRISLSWSHRSQWNS